MAECVNITTLFGGRVSVFCVELVHVQKLLSELLPNLESEYLDELLIELVTQYGKRAVTQEDTTVCSLTIVVPKRVINVEIHQPFEQIESLLATLSSGPFKVSIAS
ncbi:hypothetical protein B9Q01_04005 [Candidatus Marsarchaeota G1 archaeon OSP_D]|jgi:hypothetical protein|uniref:Uncharacterized protein n=3 Tax=Candidatus Marsarchaeota group 1 TaxID=2203770 RepID=A0A2R6AH57_9ARCH|nr:MAG: hypothetical protein B9Q01_04005 [Candidatus Marsarchaeota G1 archaeon OSP_D]PSN85678.1 MAG: hypothetical protein B9Q02_05395 [Candidatus Marsarchaeota G1 archaeon BE_D]PSN88374.1 MAG: hypothetical protein B9Q00_05665 [Candidatus Marsarchaeota G1 archaeon OSP_C]